MIVKCTMLHNSYTGKYEDGCTNEYLTKGAHYNVLEIIFQHSTIEYRVLSDDNGIRHFPILVNAKDFEMVSPILPSNWIMFNRADGNSSTIGPAKWLDNSLWKYSFWQEYDDATPRTLQCYKEEVMTIIKTDKEYIQQMISERPNVELTRNWHETMVPLFNEILAIK